MSQATEQATESSISLKGSTQMVADFFYYAVNSILYQRGVYPSHLFDTTTRYNLKVVETCDEQLKTYLDNIIKQLKEWLNDLTVTKLVLVMQDVESKSNVERWSFDIQCDKSIRSQPNLSRTEDLKAIQRGIQDVIRQIVGCVTFLPSLETSCSFDLLIFTDRDVDIPEGWDETTAKLVPNCSDLKLKGFTTSIHTVNPTISYRGGV